MTTTIEKTADERRAELLAGATRADRDWANVHGLEIGRTADGLVIAKASCPRCGGTGHYSFTPKYGTRCFDCNVASGGKQIGWRWESLERVVARGKRRERTERRADEARARDEAATAGGFVDYATVWNSAAALVALVAAERRAAELDRLTYVGTIGERSEFTVHCGKVLEFDSFYGSFAVVLTTDADGNQIVWKTSSAAGVPDEGETVRIRATVKAHAVYEKTGARQTTVERVKILN